MANFSTHTRIPAPVDDVFAWHARQGAFTRLAPPGSRFREIEHRGGIEDGAVNVFDVRVGPLWQRWVAEHDGFIPGRRFRDTQVRGPLPRWVHTHEFTAEGDKTTRIDDSIDYGLPGGPLGELAAPLAERYMLAPMFAFRHARTRHDVVRHASFPGARPRRIAVTGASGFVGSALVAYLTTAGHDVVRIGRGPDSDVVWDPSRATIEPGALEGIDAVVHLAGATIAGRWSRSKKKAIFDSRVESTRLLADQFARMADPPKTLVSASAIGCYGDTANSVVDEHDTKGTGFLSDVVDAWEAAAEPARDAGVRVVNLRTGVVLGASGGMLPTLARAVLFGGGVIVGDGRQWVSWISLDDLVGVIEWSLNTEIAGPINAVAPEPITNAQMMFSLGRRLHRPILFNAPTRAVGFALGEAAGLLLDSQRVRSATLDAARYPFLAATIDAAIGWELQGEDPAPRLHTGDVVPLEHGRTA